MIAQIDLIKSGKPLEAFDTYFAPVGRMFANDVLFASSASEGRAKQEPFIKSATSIRGLVLDININININEKEALCAFRNRTSFTNRDNQENQINGLVWQQWKDGLIVEERYYEGGLMHQKIADGVLTNPTLLSPR